MRIPFLQRRQALCGLALFAAALCPPAPAAGQLSGAGDAQPPRVFFHTSAGTTFTGATAPSPPVEIRVCEETSLNQGSLAITLNGANVTGRFTQQGTSAAECPGEESLVLTGNTGPLPQGTSTLRVQVCDMGQGVDGEFYTPNCVSPTRTFTWTSAAPRVVSIVPQQASYDSATAGLTVHWGAGGSPLNPATATIKLNGLVTAQTSAFTYTATSTTTAASTGTVTLVPGWNRVHASICDNAGVCSATDSLRLYRGSTAPAITFSPNGARQQGGPLAVTVSVQVPLATVDRSRVTFTVNGVRDSTTFGQTTTPAPPAGGDRQDYAGTLQLQPGETVLSVRACGAGGGACTVQETRFFRWTAYHAAPVLRLAYPQDRFAPSPTGMSFAVAGPSYVSMDVDRGRQLVFHGDLVDPMGVVQIDADDLSADSAVAMSIRLRDGGGAWVTFTNGTQENFYRAGNGPTRLVAQFTARYLITGVHAFTAVVTSHFADGNTAQQSIPARVLVMNESTSSESFLPGWTMPGLQRVFPQYDGGLVVREGDGSAGHYRLNFCLDAAGNRLPSTAGARSCHYVSPVGSADSLVYYTPQSAANAYWRYYPDGRVVGFHPTGDMWRDQDRFGRITWYEWNTTAYGQRRLTFILDPAGVRTSLYYDPQGVLSRIELPTAEGVNLTHQVSTPGNPSTLTAAQITSVGCTGCAKQVLSYEADPATGRVTRWRDGPNIMTTNYHSVAYDAAGQVKQVLLPEVATDSGARRPAIQMRSVLGRTHPAAATTLAAPAPRVRPEAAYLTIVSATGRDSTRVTLDRWGLPGRVVDAQGRAASVLRDSLGRTVQETSATGETTRIEWNGFRPAKVTSSSGATTELYYQNPAFPNFPTLVVGLETVARSFYGARGVVDSASVSGVGTTRYRYNADYRVERSVLVRETSRDSVVTTYTYQPGGTRNLATVTNAAGTTRFGYDVRGRTVSVLDATGVRDSVEYDANSRVTATFDTGNRAYRTRYMNDGGYPDYGFGRVESFADPIGQTYRWTANALGWTTTETDARGQVTQLTYGVDGQVTRVQNRDGSVVTLAYDNRGRIVRRTAGANVTTWEYDPDQRWMVVKNAASTDTLRFDTFGRVTSETTVRPTGTWRIESSYDAAGNRTYVTSQRLGEAPRMVARYTWQGGALTMVESGNNVSSDPAAAVRVAYDGPVARTITYPGGVVGTLTYSTTGTLSGISYGGTSSSIAAINRAAGESYGYDRAGRLVRRQPVGVDTARTVQYANNGWLSGYGAVSTLSQPCHPEPELGLVCPTPAGWWRSYTYDNAGNRIDSGAAIDLGNRLTRIGTLNYQFNVEGRVTQRYRPSQVAGGWDAQTLYQYPYWNGLGQMDSIHVTGNVDGTWRNGGLTRYAYDGLGRRIRKVRADGSVTEYVYVGDDIVLELDASGATVARYTSLPGVDATLSVERGGQRYYYLRDYQGSVSALVNTSGALVNRYRYDPWGAPEVVQEAVAQPHRYTGREYDAESGLYYYRARYYDPAAGRFISEDPIGLQGGANVYAYAGNDPVNASDPTGLSARGGDDWLKRIIDGCRSIASKGRDAAEVEYCIMEAIAYAKSRGMTIPGDDPAYDDLRRRVDEREQRSAWRLYAEGKMALLNANIEGYEERTTSFSTCVSNSGTMIAGLGAGAVGGGLALYGGLAKEIGGVAATRLPSPTWTITSGKILGMGEAGWVAGGTFLLKTGAVIGAFAASYATTSAILCWGDAGWFDR